MILSIYIRYYSLFNVLFFLPRLTERRCGEAMDRGLWQGDVWADTNWYVPKGLDIDAEDEGKFGS